MFINKIAGIFTFEWDEHQHAFKDNILEISDKLDCICNGNSVEKRVFCQTTGTTNFFDESTRLKLNYIRFRKTDKL